MTNDISTTNPEEVVPCFALSEMMTASMPPLCVASFLAFRPQDNNIIAIGMHV